MEGRLTTDIPAQHVRSRFDQQTANWIGSGGGSEVQGRRQQTVSAVYGRAVGRKHAARFGVAFSRSQV